MQLIDLCLNTRSVSYTARFMASRFVYAVVRRPVAVRHVVFTAAAV